jgi:hypothetical protein
MVHGATVVPGLGIAVRVPRRERRVIVGKAASMCETSSRAYFSSSLRLASERRVADKSAFLVPTGYSSPFKFSFAGNLPENVDLQLRSIDSSRRCGVGISHPRDEESLSTESVRIPFPFFGVSKLTGNDVSPRRPRFVRQTRRSSQSDQLASLRNISSKAT